MIPILYESNETAFTGDGICRLVSCISCTVLEERNGVYCCEFQYPVTGFNFDKITIGRIIACSHDEDGDIQPFDIYKVSEPINGVVTFYANHISYRLNEIVVMPFTANDCISAMAGLKTNSIGSNPFVFNTNKSVSAEYKVEVPSSIRGLLGGQENSILDVYGSGEYDFDKYSVYLYRNRGLDKDVSIRYGKNLIDYTNETDYGSTYNAVAPYWMGEVMDGESGASESKLITLTEGYISSGQTLPSGRTVIAPMDLSGEFETQPTEAELRTLATSKLSDSDGWQPTQNITVDFVQLWQTEEYKYFAPLQTVRLCDTILVDVPMYGVTGLRIKVVKVIWNVLLERYDEMELGNAQTTLATAINDSSQLPQEIKKISAVVQGNRVVTDNTNQHFWFTGEGTDTGVHITEVEREVFLNNPAYGGGNLLARSNGVAVRDGLTELASFRANGVEFNVNGYPQFSVLTDGSSSTKGHTTQTSVSASSTDSKELIIAGEMSNFTVGVDASDWVTATTPLSVPSTISDSATVTVDGVLFTLTKTSASTFTISYNNSNAATRYISFSYRTVKYSADIIVNDAKLNMTFPKPELEVTLGTLDYAQMAVYGHVCQIVLEVHKSTNSGANVFEANLKNYRPAYEAPLVGYYGARAAVGYIDGAGNIIVRNASSSTMSPTSDVPLVMRGTYLWYT